MRKSRKKILYAVLMIGLIALAIAYVLIMLQPAYATFMDISLMVLIFAVIAVGFIIFLDLVRDREKKRQKNGVAHYDGLTGLTNISRIESEYHSFIKKASHGQFCMICLDIFSFKRFNAIFGEEAGDKLLIVIADVLRQFYSCPSRVFRDIFIFLAENSPTMTDDIKNRLYNAIHREMGQQYVKAISFNFGVCQIIDNSKSFSDIKDSVMLAVKHAKKKMRTNFFMIFNEDLQQEENLKKYIEVNMLHALSKKEFELFIQPKYNMQTGKCGGGEALVRWKTDQFGYIAPDGFIPILERNGFIIEVDFYILTKVFDLLQSHYDQGVRQLPISVNQSKTSITFPNYIDRLKNLILQYTFPLRYVEIEITESALENNSVNVIDTIREIKELGFYIDMDDFGSGYSSLSALRKLPIDVLKIDKDFLSGAEASEKGRAILVNIINLARDLHIPVVCEGVEDSAQFDFVKSIGCNYIQGYFFARPMPASEYEQKYVYCNIVELPRVDKRR